ncbi:MAG TPA: DinB family protein [Granulicella sp.]|jgi:uncharacterized damage-inducible protein DinB|nr:DinB family protein [Granulicella sp.]
MPLYDLLLPEFDDEIKKTRNVLERLPEDRPDYKPHDKSMTLTKLANHTAELPGFLSMMLTTDSIDVMNPSVPRPAAPATGQDRLANFDLLAANARAQLAGTADRAMHENWKLSAGERVIFNGSRYHALRSMFLNHLVHHRAQLSVYLRMNDIAVPSIYGPSADEK